jgi:adenosylcobinamide kinase/adenosylcobinamide-phosphate guanylyltransferase
VLTLVLGGARSGKSAHAQAAAEAAAADGGGSLVMIATGQAFDAEMGARIEQHRRERGEAWRTIEAPVDLVGALSALSPADVAVVDCLTLWLSNLMMAEMDLEASATALIAAARNTPSSLWLVSNEVGMGVVPDNALARRFRDEAGRLHQRLAAIADQVVMVVAGLPMRVK